MSITAKPQVRYLSQAIQLEEAVNPAIIRTTIVLVGSAILAFSAWAGFTNINEVARSPGEVVPSGYEQIVQHLEGGIIAAIDIKEGQVVRKGQVLLRLDGTGIQQDLERARAKSLSLNMQEERLRAYLENRKPDFSKFGQTGSDLIKDQQNFFASSQSTNTQERRIIRDQIEQKRRMIASLQAELQTATQNQAITARLFEKKSDLHSQGYLSETKFLEAQQAVNSIEGNIAQIKNRIAVAQAEISEYNNRYNSLGFSQNDQAYERLDAVLSEKRQHAELVLKLEDQVRRLEIRSPVRGIVKGLTVNTVGSIVRPGEVLMNIVPVDEELVAEVKIMPQHIGHLKIGQNVKVKVSSYDFSRYGLVSGKLEQISATTFSGENGERYYEGRVRLDHPYVGKDPRNVISPGMTVMAEIITGEKTILQYLLKPIHNSLKTAFSER